MPRPAIRILVGALLCVAHACGGTAPQTPPEPAELSLAGLARQHIAVLPAYSVRVMPGLSWTGAIGRSADVQTTLDADILAALDERGLRKTWVFPDQLTASYKRNPSVATDPYTLALEPLRAPVLRVEQRLVEPLASQVRTLVALHDETRFVLAPVELRLEKAGDAGGRGVLRLVLVDARMSSVRWVGEISSDTAATFGPAITASIAAKLANAIAAP
jgi:hypothetical protein